MPEHEGGPPREDDGAARLEDIAATMARPLEREAKARRREQERARAARQRIRASIARASLRVAVLGPVLRAVTDLSVWVVPGFLIGFVAMAIVGEGLMQVAGTYGSVLQGALIVQGFVLPAVLVRRELRWLRALPFPVRGYVEALTVIESEYQRRVTVTIRLAGGGGAAPTPELCRTVFGRVAESVRVDGASIELTSHSIHCPSDMGWIPGRGFHRQYGVRRWLRPLVGGVLVAFHERYPIGEIVIGQPPA